MPHLLLLSNSTNFGELFLAWPEEYLRDFTAAIDGPFLFIPYAGVSISWEAYYEKVRERFAELGHGMVSIHAVPDPVQAVEEASCIVVGGGNTFYLLHHLQKYNLIAIIREKVARGTPYIGWSAGGNLACPTIKTTNDMPVIETNGFDALDLLPFQINPHFTEKAISDHSGESRKIRIEEYLQVNQGMCVMGLPEGMLLEIHNDSLYLRGSGAATLFRYGHDPRKIPGGTQHNGLLAR